MRERYRQPFQERNESQYLLQFQQVINCCQHLGVKLQVGVLGQLADLGHLEASRHAEPEQDPRAVGHVGLILQEHL